MSEHGISVVISTRGRVDLVEELLDTLDVARKASEYPSEVIIVDGSTEQDAALMRKSALAHDARFISDGPTVTVKRNRGARESLYDVVLFLDSDCLATPDLLNEHMREYDDPNVGSVAGLLEFVGPDTWLWKAVENSQFVVCFNFPRWLPSVPWTPTANCSVRRDLFEEIGGFDEEFPLEPGGEDVDMGLRLTATGRQMKCNPKALVFHQKKTWQTFGAMMRRLKNYGNADCYIMERHPENLRPCYPRRSLIFFFVSVLLAAIAALFNPLALLGIPLFLITDMLLATLSMQLYEHSKVGFWQQFMIQIFLMDNEVAFIRTSLKRGHPGFLGKQLIYFNGQVFGTQDRGAYLSLAHAASLSLLTVVLLAL